MAYIDNTDVKAIRTELKKAFPKMKFSVRKEHHSSVHISIVKGPAALESIFEGDEYAAKNRYSQLNHFHPHFYGEHEALVRKISEIAHTAPAGAGGANNKGYYDNSDAMTDYFDTAYYVNLAIGKWDKPYEAV